jgi:diguanylate cyclase (GGDEF)-like protein
MAYRDELTGAWNRRFYESFMKQVLRDAARSRLAVTVLVFDIDDFKRYNDDFGHDAGDEVLRETVRLLESVIRSGDRVCRMGGDEFVVVFADLAGPREPGSNPPDTVESIAARFQDQVCRMRFPKLGLDAPGTLSISGGLATFPWDGNDATSLLRHADQLALQSKRNGKNVITFGPGIQKKSH